MYNKYRPSRTAARKFAQKMQEIDDFCREHGIAQSSTGDSYYFTINGQRYRVSNHTVAQSNRGAYDWTGEKVRNIYHPNGEDDDVIYITASKIRIIDIYSMLVAGRKLDRRGYPID